MIKKLLLWRKRNNRDLAEKAFRKYIDITGYSLTIEQRRTNVDMFMYIYDSEEKGKYEIPNFI